MFFQSFSNWQRFVHLRFASILLGQRASTRPTTPLFLTHWPCFLTEMPAGQSLLSFFVVEIGIWKLRKGNLINGNNHMAVRHLFCYFGTEIQWKQSWFIEINKEFMCKNSFQDIELRIFFVFQRFCVGLFFPNWTNVFVFQTLLIYFGYPINVKFFFATSFFFIHLLDCTWDMPWAVPPPIPQ